MTREELAIMEQIGHLYMVSHRVLKGDAQYNLERRYYHLLIDIETQVSLPREIMGEDFFDVGIVPVPITSHFQDFKKWCEESLLSAAYSP